MCTLGRDLPSFPTLRSSDLCALPSPRIVKHRFSAHERGEHSRLVRITVERARVEHREVGTVARRGDRTSTRLHSSHVARSYAVVGMLTSAFTRRRMRSKHSV